MKNKVTPRLAEVPYEISSEAVLLRSRGDGIFVKLLNPVVFATHQMTFFGSAQVCIIEQKDDIVTIRILQGILPTRGRLTQSRVTTNPHQVFQEFQKFWMPIWKRETAQEQSHPDAWSSFREELQKCELPSIDIQIDMFDPHVWWKSIMKLKRKKAEGICGWRHEELQDLSFLAVSHLCVLFRKIWKVGFSPQMMQAKTTLLSKVEHPVSMNHGRPITILSSIYRLVSKIIYDQIAVKWSAVLPPTVSGGLPGRGVRDLALRQSFAIEQAISRRECLLGASIDLTKAFNLISRQPASDILSALGVPKDVVSFWALNMTRLSRLPCVSGTLGPVVHSTTGVPEGDSVSVLVMVGLSTVFYFRLLRPQLVPSAYADNWSWFTDNEREMFVAFTSLLNLVSSLRMSVDIKKSWVWSTNKNSRQTLLDLNNLFPSGDHKLEIKSSSLDLGEILQYGKKWIVGPLVDRVQEAVVRIGRLQWIPISLDKKCQYIQAAGWAFGLYGADMHFLGSQHYQKLRRSVVVALAGHHRSANPILATLVLSKFLQDPMAWVLSNLFCNIRRMAKLDLTLATSFIEFAVQQTPSKPFGPASSMMSYLRSLDWNIDHRGVVTISRILKFDCLRDCAKYIRRQITLGWMEHAIDQCSHRRGIKDQFLDIPTTISFFSTLDDTLKRIVILNMIGGFQTEFCKSKWASDAEEKCLLCGAVDHQDHRMLFCPCLSEVREQFPDVVENISNNRLSWIYHPFAHQFPHIRVLQAFFMSIEAPSRQVHINSEQSHLRFYTDGGCEDPTEIDFRHGSWSVILDHTTCESERCEAAASISPQLVNSPLFECIGTGLVSGPQSASRGEMQACVVACQVANQSPSCVQAEIFTDSQYVIHTVESIVQNQFMHRLDKIAHSDLVIELSQHIAQKEFIFHKVKSHRHITDATDFADLWSIVGNHLADMACTASLKRIPKEIRDLLNAAREHRKNEKKCLERMFAYLAALNRCRSVLISKLDKKPNVREQELGLHDAAVSESDALGQHAGVLMQNFSLLNGAPYIHVELDPELAIANLQGVRLAHAIWKWLSSLKWSTDPSLETTGVFKWGISWLELFFNFHLTTGFTLPIKINRQNGTPQYLDYFSVECQMLPDRLRSVGNQLLLLQHAIRLLENLMKTKTVPPAKKWGGVSLKRLLFYGKCASIEFRPQMLKQSETTQRVLQYLQSLNGAKSFWGPLTPHIASPCIFIPDDIVEIPYEERLQRYLRVKKNA